MFLFQCDLRCLLHACMVGDLGGGSGCSLMVANI